MTRISGTLENTYKCNKLYYTYIAFVNVLVKSIKDGTPLIKSNVIKSVNYGNRVYKECCLLYVAHNTAESHVCEKVMKKMTKGEKELHKQRVENEKELHKQRVKNEKELHKQRLKDEKVEHKNKRRQLDK